MKRSEAYNGLYQLVEKDADAEKLFSSLPEYVKESISSRADNIHTYEDLSAYAGKLLRGDG